MHRKAYVFFTLMAVAAALVPCAACAENYVALFNRVDRQINDGKGYSEKLNDEAWLAWGESYMLQAYVDMYFATGETKYLDKVVDHFDRVLANRDDKRKVNEYYRKKPMAGWGCEKYSPGRWHVWAVHTGLIGLGPAEFVRIVRGDKELSRKYGNQADDYLEALKECVAAHEPDWHEGPNKGEGYYTDPEVSAGGANNLPVNMPNGIGLLQVELYMVTRDEMYRDKAEKIARYFKNRLRKRDDGSYDWSYWPKLDGPGDGSEDISHASINVKFADLCCQAKIVFDEKDMQAFAKTWTLHVRKGDGKWSDTVAGGSETNKYVPGAVGTWLDMCRYDKSILDDGKEAFAAVKKPSGGWNLLGIAKLARWEKELKSH